MMKTGKLGLYAALGAIPMLSACGGSGGGLASTPPPIIPPPPPPPPLQSSPETRFGVTTDATFAAVGDAVALEWSEADQAYTLVTPTGSAQLTLGTASETSEDHFPSASSYGVNLRKDLDYQYTNLAVLYENAWGYSYGTFAYGIPTADNDVPVTGTASYTAMAYGGTTPSNGIWEYYIGGDAHLTFNFGAGSLSGYFDPTISDGSRSSSLGRYDFVNTVFGVGSTNFSGSLQNSSLGQLGSFDGLFTGPAAAELMAQWTAAYTNPWTNQAGTISGVWIGKKN